MNISIENVHSILSNMKNQISYVLGFLVVALFSGVVLAQQADINAALSPVPIWPADGLIPPELQDRYVFLDFKAGQMVLAYPKNAGQPNSERSRGLQRVERFDLNNQVKPSLLVTVRPDGEYFTYRYRVSNAKQAKQAIRSLQIPVAELSDDYRIFAPANWSATASPAEARDVPIGIGRASGVSLNWYVNDPSSIDSNASAVMPGHEEGGFHVTSALKPGFTLAHARGRGSRVNLPEDLPPPVLEQAAAYCNSTMAVRPS